ncbi:MAG: methyl-accepting chemotaxis protein [Gammaproteobacteria bacterium]|nr:methyl-accepting chemotaxis protein [Gammaproteobacteria bacterium]
MNFSNLSLGKKLISSFLLVGIVPFAILGAIALNNASTALEDQSFNQLEAVRGIKKAQMENYIAKTKHDMQVLRETVATLRQDAMSKLEAIRDNKANGIQAYLDTVKSQVLTFANSQVVTQGMARMDGAFHDIETSITSTQADTDMKRMGQYYINEFNPQFEEQNQSRADLDAMMDIQSIAKVMQTRYIQDNPNPLGSKEVMDQAKDGSQYSQLHAEYHPVVRQFLQEFGYYDIFFVNTDGDIVYSVFKELDYATNLLSGPYADTGFAEVARRSSELNHGEIAISDMALYSPSYNAPAAFIATPIFSAEQRLGNLVFQIPLDKITNVMNERAGLGVSGETYLVGEDYLMRSDSYLDPVAHSVVESFRHPETGKAVTAAVTDALAGNTKSTVIIDYNGNPVLSAYSPFQFEQLNWALLSEIDVAEAFVPHIEGHKQDFYSDYIELYGYYDLFLINPDGYIFYTVAKEDDYQTNLITGAYADSGLGTVFREALENKRLAFADFKPYAPSNNEPASFVAEPIINADGEVEAIVALQLPLDTVNAIMGQRDGMGQSGESYLVGPDNLMRSDSYLDPTNHSVVASFANPELGRVDSIASAAALSGEAGTQIIIDYNGNPVLSAYTPLDIFGTQWALLSEIDEAEAFASTNYLVKVMGSVGIIGLILIIGFAWIVSRSISNPIISLSNMFTQLGQSGDFSKRSDHTEAGGEIGDMAKVVNEHLSSLQAAINESNTVVGKVAVGKFEQRIEADFKGDLALLKNGINSSADSVEQTMTALKQVLNALATGQFSYRLDDIKVEGDFHNTLINTMETMQTAIGEINHVMNAAANGDFDQRIEVTLSGDLETLKQGVNQSIEAISKAINETTAMSELMAQGDMTCRVDGHYLGRLDQLKSALNNSIDNMESAITSVIEVTETVTTNATEISDGCGDLAQRTSEQSASLEQTSASLEEMSSTVEHNANRSTEATGLISNATESANQGVGVVKQAVEAMAAIENSSEKIVSIISLIDGIAFQTNLLALNASVEAARAGEHGRGFAVVAGEVRTLAQRAADAAKEIKGLIEDSANRVQEGRDLVHRTGENLTDIQASVNQVDDIMREISTATAEQNSVIMQINTAVGQLESVNQQNTALVEESSAACSSLSEQTQNMKQQMSFFTVTNIQEQPLTETYQQVTAELSAPALEPTAEVSSNKPSTEFDELNDDQDEWQDF